MDKLVELVGLERIGSFYSNLRCLKELNKHIDVEKRTDLMELWIEFEEALNSQFLKDSNYQWGDSANLWRIMGSRTVILRQYKENSRDII